MRACVVEPSHYQNDTSGEVEPSSTIRTYSTSLACAAAVICNTHTRHSNDTSGILWRCPLEEVPPMSKGRCMLTCRLLGHPDLSSRFMPGKDHSEFDWRRIIVEAIKSDHGKIEGLIKYLKNNKYEDPSVSLDQCIKKHISDVLRTYYSSDVIDKILKATANVKVSEVVFQRDLGDRMKFLIGQMSSYTSENNKSLDVEDYEKACRDHKTRVSQILTRFIAHSLPDESTRKKITELLNEDTFYQQEAERLKEKLRDECRLQCTSPETAMQESGITLDQSRHASGPSWRAPDLNDLTGGIAALGAKARSKKERSTDRDLSSSGPENSSTLAYSETDTKKSIKKAREAFFSEPVTHGQSKSTSTSAQPVPTFLPRHKRVSMRIELQNSASIDPAQDQRQSEAPQIEANLEQREVPTESKGEQKDQRRAAASSISTLIAASQQRQAISKLKDGDFYPHEHNSSKVTEQHLIVPKKLTKSSAPRRVESESSTGQGQATPNLFTLPQVQRDSPAVDAKTVQDNAPIQETLSEEPVQQWDRVQEQLTAWRTRPLERTSSEAGDRQDQRGALKATDAREVFLLYDRHQGRIVRKRSQEKSASLHMETQKDIPNDPGLEQSQGVSGTGTTQHLTPQTEQGADGQSFAARSTFVRNEPAPGSDAIPGRTRPKFEGKSMSHRATQMKSQDRHFGVEQSASEEPSRVNLKDESRMRQVLVESRQGFPQQAQPRIATEVTDKVADEIRSTLTNMSRPASQSEMSQSSNTGVIAEESTATVGRPSDGPALDSVKPLSLAEESAALTMMIRQHSRVGMPSQRKRRSFQNVQDFWKGQETAQVGMLPQGLIKKGESFGLVPQRRQSVQGNDDPSRDTIATIEEESPTDYVASEVPMGSDVRLDAIPSPPMDEARTLFEKPAPSYAKELTKATSSLQKEAQNEQNLQEKESLKEAHYLTSLTHGQYDQKSSSRGEASSMYATQDEETYLRKSQVPAGQCDTSSSINCELDSPEPVNANIVFESGRRADAAKRSEPAPKTVMVTYV